MTQEPSHDRLFKETFSYLSEAKRFLETFLPGNLSNNLDLPTIKFDRVTFLNERMREFYSDANFTCSWKGGGEVRLNFLIEHKSNPEKYPHLQLGSYLMEAYNHQAKQLEKDKQDGLLTPIITIILYHGNENWKERTFAGCFQLPSAELLRFLPAFEFILINLADYSDEDILALGASFLTATLLLFKHKQDKNFVLSNFDKIFIFVNAEGDKDAISRFFRMIILYLFKSFSFENREIESIVENLPENTKQMFESTYDKLIQEGMVKGEVIGIRKGEAIGIRKGEAIGECRRSLEIVIDLLTSMPAVQNADIARLAKLPEPLIQNLREYLLAGKVAEAQNTALSLFKDLPGFNKTEGKKIKTLIENACQHLSAQNKN